MRIAAAVLREVIAHAREDAPDECCGLLVGPAPPRGMATAGLIDEAIRAVNLDRGPARYRIDPAQHIAVQKRLRGTGRVIAGAYHSHPRSEPLPSRSDLDEAFYPDFVYVIVSLMRPAAAVRAWRIRDGVAAEITIEATP